MATKQGNTTELSKQNSDEADKVLAERGKNANPGFFLKSAVWLLSRFPLTKNKYQNWTAGRRILVGMFLWLIVLPIIPIAAMVVWYVNDPEGFKKSPWAKVLVTITLVWAGAFGIIATEPAQLDQNGKYSPVQTEPDGEKGSIDTKPASAATEEAKEKVKNQTVSKESNGKEFENCTAAFNSGVFNIKRSDSSYASKLDRDDDGIACEK